MDSTNVYWVDVRSTTRTLLRAPIGGGAAVMIDSGPVGATIAVDSSGFYWVGSSGNLLKAPILGGSSGAAITVASTGGPMALDSSTVYWATASAIMKVAK